jgi:hypothetical protein
LIGILLAKVRRPPDIVRTRKKVDAGHPSASFLLLSTEAQINRTKKEKRRRRRKA